MLWLGSAKLNLPRLRRPLIVALSPTESQRRPYPEVTDGAVLALSVPPRWTINSTGGLERSLDQGTTWQVINVNANPAYFTAATSAQIPEKVRAKIGQRKIERCRLRLSCRGSFRRRRLGGGVRGRSLSLARCRGPLDPRRCPRRPRADAHRRHHQPGIPRHATRKSLNLERGSLDHHRRWPDLAETMTDVVRNVHRRTFVCFDSFELCAHSVTKVTFTQNEGDSSIHLVVWQFWGRAAEASWTEKSRALFLFSGSRLLHIAVTESETCASSRNPTPWQLIAIQGP